MLRGGGTVAFGEWGEVGPRVALPGGGPVADDARRRRLSPEFARPPCAAGSSSWSSSSSLEGPPDWLPMERPPGRLLAGEGPPGMLIAEARPIGRPAGMLEGRVPCGALRQAWVRFLPSGWVTRGWSFAVVNVYTRPVSDTTRSRTCVPVRVESSYAWAGVSQWARIKEEDGLSFS